MDRYELPASLSIAYGNIDAEHQGLVDTLNAALRMSRSEPNAPVNYFLPFLRNLRDGMKHHFLHEEQEMAKLGYPELAQHKLHHANCARRLEEIQAAIVAGEKTADKDLLDELFDMILDDIIRADSGFKSFLHSRNLVAPG